MKNEDFMACVVLFVVLAGIIIALFIPSPWNQEIDKDEYANVTKWVALYPTMKPDVTKALRDNKITRGEYNAIERQFGQVMADIERTNLISTLKDK